MERKSRVIDIDGERISLAKSDNIWGWRVVHPIKDENGKINLMNLLFGGKGNLIILIFIMFIVACAVYGFHEVTSSCADMAQHPCKYFSTNCAIATHSQMDYSSMNLSIKSDKIGP